MPTHSVTYDGQSYEQAYIGTLVRRINEGKYNPYINAIEYVNPTQLPEEEVVEGEGETTAETTTAG